MNDGIRRQLDDLRFRLQVRAYVGAVRACQHVWSDPVMTQPGGAEYRDCLVGCGRAWWTGDLEPGSPEELRLAQERERLIDEGRSL